MSGPYQLTDMHDANSFLQVPGQTCSRGASVDGTASRDPFPSPFLPPSPSPGGSDDNLVKIPSISLTDAEPDKESPPLGHLASVWMVIRLSKLNLLFVCMIVSWILHFVWPEKERSIAQDAAIFTLAFLAIMPLANLLSFCTDQLAIRYNETIAAFLNVTFGNAVEFIVAILALKAGEVEVVQASLVGSVLSNNLFVFGAALLAGGLKFKQQKLGNMSTVWQTTMAIVTAFVPFLVAGFLHVAVILQALEVDASVRGNATVSALAQGNATNVTIGALAQGNATVDPSAFVQESAMELKISRGMAAFALLVYVGLVLFQNGTHKDIIARGDAEAARQSVTEPWSRVPWWAKKAYSKNSEEEEEVKISLWVVYPTLIASIALVAFTADVLVASITGLTSTGKISKEFVSLILLPIPGNAAEHWTAISAALQDRVTMSMGISLGSSAQVSMFLYPLMIAIGLASGHPLGYLTSVTSFLALLLSVVVVFGVVCVMGATKINWWLGIPPLTVFSMVAIVCLIYN